MVGEDDEEPPLRQEKRFLKNQRLKFKVGVVLQHVDLAHKGALLRSPQVDVVWMFCV